MAPADAARGAVREEFVARAYRAHARISHARAIDACLFEPDRQRLQQVDMAFVGNAGGTEAVFEALAHVGARLEAGRVDVRPHVHVVAARRILPQLGGIGPRERADGLRECRKLLMLAKAGKFDGYLLEGMACPGGCIAGAGTVISSDAAAKKLQQHMAEADIQSSADSPYADLADQLNEP